MLENLIRLITKEREYAVEQLISNSKKEIGEVKTLGDPPDHFYLIIGNSSRLEHSRTILGRLYRTYLRRVRVNA